MKYMDVKEFREAGYLQEVNRNFFHPLGLALEVVVGDDGTEHLGGVWDCREDPEGVLFDSLESDKAEFVANELLTRVKTRLDALGYIFQPVTNEADSNGESSN